METLLEHWYLLSNWTSCLNRGTIFVSVMNNLSAKMKNYDFTIVNTLVESIKPLAEVKESMNRIYATEKLKQDAKYIRELRQEGADKERK